MTDFQFAFLVDGRLQRSDQMTREELVHMIEYLLLHGERHWWANEAMTAFSVGDSLVVRRPKP